MLLFVYNTFDFVPKIVWIYLTVNSSGVQDVQSPNYETGNGFSQRNYIAAPPLLPATFGSYANNSQDGVGLGWYSSTNSSYGSCTRSRFSGNTLYWFARYGYAGSGDLKSADRQLNETNTRYYWIAIG